MAPKLAIVIYSMYGHIATLAEAVKAGVESAGGTVEILQIPETLPEEVLAKMYAPPKPAYRVVNKPDELLEYDAFIFGIPTRYGNFPAQWKAFIDQSGGIWQKGGFYGKYVGLFVSTASLGGGQESTALATMSTLAHHGMIYVPFGYAKAFGDMVDLSEVHGGSPWGAGTFAGPDGSRQPTDREKKLATIQGTSFWETISKVNF
ncbi:hypothetical protein TWF694_005028 [Orbilia ellipsospora]|uniref:Flavodoxin-like domain-containing protein n=1 Tax=Orbilia ellipsospora TaxID=2528407 RepID=A0AAV9WUN6_9PEZI